MKEGDEYRILPGGKKKFLFLSSSSSTSHSSTDYACLPKVNNTSRSPQALPLDLDSVWSIRNVGLASSSKMPLSEPSSIKPEVFSKSAGTAFYSRHGIMKGTPNHAARSSNSAGNRVQWSSSGFNLSQGSRFGTQSPAHLGGESNHRQQPSPLDLDISDF
uniref:Uncharacterized protein n=1 Tax=Arion vulgaris TaxID=1028688 RepID=A0A0B6Y854_9EUPU